MPKGKLRVVRLSWFSLAALWTIAAIVPSHAQVTFNSGTAPGGLRLTCVNAAGALTFDNDSATTCAGAQTSVTGITVNNGSGFTATGTAGVTVSGSGAISTTSGSISSTSGNITTTAGTVSGATVSSTGATTVGTNLSVGGSLDMTNGAIQNVTNITGTGAISGFSSVTATGAVQGGSVTDGTATLTGGNLTGVGTLSATTGNIGTINSTTVGATNVNSTNVTATGTVRGGSVTDGTATISGGNVAGVNTLSAQTINAANTNTTGTTSTTALTVGTGGITIASGAPVNAGGNRIQNVGTPVAATDAANKAYVDSLAGNASVQLSEAFKQIDRNADGVALAIALGGLVLPAGKTFAIGANLGFFEGKEAMATQLTFRLSDELTFNAGAGFAIGSGTTGGRVGISAAW